ncbi:unnamed protein product [Darwinula stevensoni]|uniref:DRBM domain-containing protein n=1 Tax=Darwinula stevensoni TaxID=69355 RepID=A0A7R8X3P7_9CRUS|nr:unnamed protein product [Darwinula stevensoni]CAG0878827.1 unnamed protein product [Darwinula stevensoni]
MQAILEQNLPSTAETDSVGLAPVRLLRSSEGDWEDPRERTSRKVSQLRDLGGWKEVSRFGAPSASASLLNGGGGLGEGVMGTAGCMMPLQSKMGLKDQANVAGAHPGPHDSSQPQLQRSLSQAQDPTSPSKEKTPMCLVNELARHNKIQHQYRLINETGPAHKKTFSVMLKLGDEEYTAPGPSIKKAQHAAAAAALENTQYKKPVPKARACGHQMAPTVELNAVAMKRGEPCTYSIIEPPSRAYNPYYAPRATLYNRPYTYMPRAPYGPPSIFCVSLRVGNREYIGDGHTVQAARHTAAAKALQELRNLPLPEQANQNDSKPNDIKALDPNADLKSPISLVHEVALKQNLSVRFEVVQESGPPHMKTFITQCIVGQDVTQGDGHGKKLSKKNAAEKMLEKLAQMPAVTTPAVVSRTKRKVPTTTKKKNRIIKEQGNMEYGQGINPISRLIQIQQAKKEREPVYSLLAEKGFPRKREFIIQVVCGDHTAQGSGPNKKIAKRAAAEALLEVMGYSQPTPQPEKSVLKTPGTNEEKKPPGKACSFLPIPNNVTFVDGEMGSGTVKGGAGGRQLVPGLLLMSDNSIPSAPPNSYRLGGGSASVGGGGGLSGGNGSSGGGGGRDGQGAASHQTTATIAQELLKGGNSPTAEALQVQGQMSNVSQNAGGPAVRPKHQLFYLASVLNFTVQFSDFPRGNKTEYLSLVTLSTSPPQVFHGSGPTVEASHDQAALNALKQLAEVGLDSAVKEPTPPSSSMHNRSCNSPTFLSHGCDNLLLPPSLSHHDFLQSGNSGSDSGYRTE